MVKPPFKHSLGDWIQASTDHTDSDSSRFHGYNTSKKMVVKSSAEHISRQGPLTSLGQGQSWGWAKRSLSLGPSGFLLLTFSAGPDASNKRSWRDRWTRTWLEDVGYIYIWIYIYIFIYTYIYICIDLILIYAYYIYSSFPVIHVTLGDLNIRNSAAAPWSDLRWWRTVPKPWHWICISPLHGWALGILGRGWHPTTPSMGISGS